VSTQVRGFEITIPAGTAKDAPVTRDMSFPPMTVADITVTVPPGPNGNLGIQIASAGSQVIPWNDGEWLVPNDVVMTWTPDGYADSGSWQLVGYNTGAFDHTVWVRFNLAPVAAVGTPTAGQPVDLAAVSNAPAAGA
jgi:hypothetical protein